MAADLCDLRELVEEVAEQHRDVVAAKGLSLGCDAPEVQRVRVPAGMALCVVNNLVDNAIQHTERGCIDLRLRRNEVQVQDSGRGIPAYALNRIFDRRFRGAQSRGLGLGLYIVKRICDRLGWRIEVANAPDAGACFTLRMSAAPITDQRNPDDPPTGS